jgi:hypothetical protein
MAARRDESGRFTAPAGDRTPHAARGEVFSPHHQAEPDSRRGSPSWARRLDDDALADASQQDHDNPPDTTPTTPRPPR